MRIVSNPCFPLLSDVVIFIAMLGYRLLFGLFVFLLKYNK